MKRREHLARKRAQPNFTRTERTFECGGNNDTITIDDRLLDAGSFKELMKKKKEAELAKDDQLRTDLFLDDFDYEEERLQVKEIPREGLFLSAIIDPALPARAYTNPRSATPSDRTQRWMNTQLANVNRGTTPSQQEVEDKLKMDLAMQKISRIIGFEAKDEPENKVVSNNFVEEE